MSWFTTAVKDVEKVVITAAPVAAGAFAGPGAQGLVSAVINEIQGMVSQGTTPNKALLTTSIGQIIEGVIGVLQATGKIPQLDVVQGQSALRTLEVKVPAPAFPLKA